MYTQEELDDTVRAAIILAERACERTHEQAVQGLRDRLMACEDVLEATEAALDEEKAKISRTRLALAIIAVDLGK